MFNFKNSNSGKIRVKLLATLLVLTLTFANFALVGSYVGEAIAAEIDLSKQTDETNSNNVKFDIYLDEVDKTVKEKIADINSQEMKLYVSVSVQNGGYLNNPVIELSDTNFKFRDNPKLTSVKLDSIQSGNGMSEGLPIVARNDESYNLALLNMQSQIRLTGEYVDAEGNVTEIDTPKAVKISWTTDSVTADDIELNQNIITNKIYDMGKENKRIIQTLVTLKVKDNKAPIETALIEINNPEIGVAPESVKVAGYTTKATNGKTHLEFNDGLTSQWAYNTETNLVSIVTNNEANEQNIVSWEKDCVDKYIITYVYNENAVVAPFTCDSKVTMGIHGTTNVIEKTNTLSLETLEETGEIVTLDSNITNKIYKGNMYLGEETTYETKTDLYIPYTNAVYTIVIADLGDEISGLEQKSYYKTTKINKADALKVLGTGGKIVIYDYTDGKEGAEINKISLSEQTEGDYYTFSYDTKISQVEIAFIPTVEDSLMKSTEGIIEIINEKAIEVENIEIVPEITELTTNLKLMGSNLDYEQSINANITNKVSILEPDLTFDISLKKNTLSTQIEDEIEITTELKAVNSSNKLFNNPTIKIELPKEVTEASLENITEVLYDDELTLNGEKVEIVTNEAGNKELVIVLEGAQTKYNTSAQNATITANLKVKANQFVADKNVEIKATCINNAQSEENKETVESKENVKLVSKSGLITKNTITIGENVIEKINQNTVDANISENTNATISSSIINNFGENVSNINIVGNIPEGVTLTNGIASKIQGVQVSYSEETNPGIDSDSWKTKITDEELAKMKSFKITLAELANGNTIDLSYSVNANIENVQVNTALTNNLTIDYVINEQAKQEKIAFALNIVEKGTGSENPTEPEEPVVPQGQKATITINPKATTNTLYEGQIVTYEIKVKNTSAETLNNVTLDYTVPQGAVLTELTYAQGTNVTFTDDTASTNKTWAIESLSPNQTITKEVTLKIINGVSNITNKANLKDAENNVIIEVQSEPTLIKEGKVSAILSRRDNMDSIVTEGSNIQYVVIVKNNTNYAMNNVTITSQVPNQTKLVVGSEYNQNWEYDENSNKLEYTINTLEAGQTLDIRFEVEVENIQNGICEATIDNTAVVALESGEAYETNVYTSYVLMPKWDIHMTATHNATLKEGDNVKYIITVSNTGKIPSTISLQDILPDEIQFRKATYYTNPEYKIEDTIIKKEINIPYSVEEGETLTLEIEGVIYDLEDNVPSKQISNVAKIDLGNNEYLESETITNTIINDVVEPEEPQDPEDPGDPEDPKQPQKPNGEAYSISGLAWFDENKNGIRDNQEKIIQSVKVMLLDVKGNKVSETVTSLTGTYKFSDLAKGEYIVIFDYDETKYGVAKYQVKDANNENNSDAISKQIKLNEENITVGVTDIIKVETEDIVNIDIGLIQNPNFDLSLNKYISKVVVTNNSGTSTYTYEDTQLAKVEISAKQLAGTVLLVEYEIEVSNEGDVDGYVTDIIDYLPKELEFNSEMNTEWYLGTDNYLHYMALDPQAIEPGKTRSVKLVLTKTLKSDSTGTIENTAEIAQSANLEGLLESDSTSNNKKDGEDDISKASLIVSIKTGSPIMYIGIVLASMMILGTGIYIIDKKVLRVRM